MPPTAAIIRARRLTIAALARFSLEPLGACARVTFLPDLPWCTIERFTVGPGPPLVACAAAEASLLCRYTPPVARISSQARDAFVTPGLRSVYTVLFQQAPPTCAICISEAVGTLPNGVYLPSSSITALCGGTPLAALLRLAHSLGSLGSVSISDALWTPLVRCGEDRATRQGA